MTGDQNIGMLSSALGLFIKGNPNNTAPENEILQAAVAEVNLDDVEKQVQQNYSEMTKYQNKPQDIAKAIASDDPTKGVVTLNEKADDNTDKSTKEVITDPGNASPQELQKATDEIIKNPDAAVSGPTLSEATDIADNIYKGKVGICSFRRMGISGCLQPRRYWPTNGSICKGRRGWNNGICNRKCWDRIN